MYRNLLACVYECCSTECFAVLWHARPCVTVDSGEAKADNEVLFWALRGFGPKLPFRYSTLKTSIISSSSFILIESMVVSPHSDLSLLTAFAQSNRWKEGNGGHWVSIGEREGKLAEFIEECLLPIALLPLSILEMNSCTDHREVHTRAWGVNIDRS